MVSNDKANAPSPSTTAPANESKWLTLVEDQDARVSTFSFCMALVDLRGEGRCSLIVADLQYSSGQVYLRAFDGNSWKDAIKLPALPSGVTAIYLESSDASKKKVPALAVSVGNTVLVYKSLKPLCRYQLPPLVPLQGETDLWQAVKEKTITSADLFARLAQLRAAETECRLTRRSNLFLATPEDEREQFVAELVDKPLTVSSSITCLSTLNSKYKEENSEQFVVLGTESRHVHIVDVLAGVNKAQHEFPDVPVTIATHGTFQEKYRLFVSCRDGKIYIVTKDFSDLTCVTPKDRPVTLLSTGKYLAVPCMNGAVYFYKGKNDEMQLKVDAPIVCAEFIKYDVTGLRLVIVALANKEVHVYKDDQLVDSFVTDEVVIAMTYGKFDREDGALVLVLRNGTVVVKLIKRRAKFEPAVAQPTLVPFESLLPKRSALFLDQVTRERENCKSMNTAIFDNLARLKYEVNRRYVDSLQGSASSASLIRHDIIVTPQLLGSGPAFKLLVTVNNLSTDKPLTDFHIHLSVDQKAFAMPRPLVELPYVVPGGNYAFWRLLRFVGSQVMQYEIAISLLKHGHSVPVISVVATIPEPDVVI